MSFSLIIPCFNEANNVLSNKKKIIQFAKEQNCEIIFINNGSKDNTEIVLKSICENNDNFILISFENNIGYGGAVLAGVKNSTNKIISWIHGDFFKLISYILLNFMIILKEMIKSFLFIKGIRQNRKLTEIFFTMGMSAIVSIFFLKRYMI